MFCFQADTWTTVSLTSSLHTAHSTPAQNKKGRRRLCTEYLVSMWEHFFIVCVVCRVSLMQRGRH